MNAAELRLHVELLVQQKILVEHRLGEIRPHLESSKAQIKQEPTDDHLLRLRKLDEKHNALRAQLARLEHDLFVANMELVETERLDRKSYAGKVFCMEFVKVAKEKLPPEMYEHFKAEAVRRQQQGGA